MSNLPNLYTTEQQGERTWVVLYGPKNEAFAYVVARDGEPAEDGKYRANMLANVMNATKDMTASNIRQLLAVYEEHYGEKYHADWRGGDDE